MSVKDETNENTGSEEESGQEPETRENEGQNPDEGQEPKENEGEKGSDGEKPKEKEDGDSGDEETLSPEELRKNLTRVRREAADWRTKFRDAEKKLADAKTPEEIETARTEMRAEFEATERNLLIELVAAKKGLPDDITKALSKTFEKSGTREEIEEYATTLAKYVAADGDDREPSGGLNPDDDADAFDPVKEARAARRRRF